MDIIEIIQEEVNKIAKEKFSDCCDVDFIASVMYEDYIEKTNPPEDYEHRIALTIVHSDRVFTKVIFPQTGNVYGYPSIEDEMTALYNRTM